jgi:hypothetical protein
MILYKVGQYNLEPIRKFEEICDFELCAEHPHTTQNRSLLEKAQDRYLAVDLQVAE